VPFKVLSLEGLQVTKFAAGLFHSLFLTQKGQVYTTGVESIPSLV
jgi:alpha-tubulin suppressor-like RCC1 family protein